MRSAVHRLFLIAAVALFSALSIGCASSTRIYVRSSDQTNDGNTLYMMVKNVDGKPVVSEHYADVARTLFTDPPDPAIIVSQPVFPGNTVTITLENTEKEVVIYFFYTDPGSNWRVPLRKPLPAEVFIELGQHQIERVQIRKR